MQDFWTLYSGLTREGPGDKASLARALQGLAKEARIFDAACGSGADSAMMLDMLPEVEIIGVDKHPEFIAAAKARGLRADFHVSDMLAPDGKFDLIWCAGAVYFVGIEAALKAWGPHLEPGGRIAFSEVVWLTDTPSNAAKTFWQEAYPQIGTIASMRQRIEGCGFNVTSATPLGRAGWQHYYASLAARISELRKSPVSDNMAAVLVETEAEIALFEAHFGEYDYAVFLVQPL
ncbi:MAG: class I SAM-dependent methyltransferase [Paracoccaceae bacterium]